MKIQLLGVPERDELMSSLEKELVPFSDVIRASSFPTEFSLLFIDIKSIELRHAIQIHDRKGNAVVLVAKDEPTEIETAMDLLATGHADDVLIWPYRSVEVFGRIKNYQQILKWGEVHQLNQTFGNLLEQFQESMDLLGRLHLNKLPNRLPKMKGFEFSHRYIAGERPGGDFFDLAEAPQGDSLHFLVSDSSSYGLSGAVLSVLMRLVGKLGFGAHRTHLDLVRAVRDEVLATLRVQDQLSIVSGSISKKSLAFKYLSLGGIHVGVCQKDRGVKWIPAHEGAMSRNSGTPRANDGEYQLAPGDRLLLLTDGFVSLFDSVDSLGACVSQFIGLSGNELLNELAFAAKRNLKGDQLPAQDATGLVIDIDARTLRLA